MDNGKLGFREVFGCPGRRADPVGPGSFVFSVHKGLGQVGSSFAFDFCRQLLSFVLSLVWCTAPLPLFFFTCTQRNGPAGSTSTFVI